MTFPSLQQQAGMAEAVNGRAITVHGVELTMISIAQCGDIVEKNRGIDAWLGFEVAENDQWLFPIA